MKNLYLISIFLFGFSSAQSQIFSPKTGKIIFEEALVITNTQKIDSALIYKKPILSNMFRDIMFEAIPVIGIDSAAINNHVKNTIVPGLDYILDPRKSFTTPIVQIYTFKDSVIEYQIKESLLDKNNEIEVINRATGKSSYFRLKDSVMVPDNLTLRAPIEDIDKNIKITEYRNDKKTILGYNCFKVILTKNTSMLSTFMMLNIDLSQNLKEEYSAYLEPISTQIMYVTEQINCKYHPKVKSSRILDNYYPLEIVTYDGFRDGVETRFTLKKINIQ